MKIDKIQALRGPNIWSVQRKKLIQMRLDLEEMEQFPTNKIEGFRERIEAMFPTMIEHRCSEGVPGGFFSRIERGTWMGHVIEHIALEIQTLAGMETGFGRTRETKTPGVYNVVFSYTEENVGMFAAESAVAIAEALIAGIPYDLEADIQKMREIRERVRLGPSTGSIVEEAVSRDIPWIRLQGGAEDRTSVRLDQDGEGSAGVVATGVLQALRNRPAANRYDGKLAQSRV